MTDTRMTVQKIERYLRSTHTTTGAVREALVDGFVVYERQTEQLLECLKRNDHEGVFEIMKATLIDSWGNAAQRWHDEKQAQQLREVGGSIHERGMRKAV